MASSAPRTSSIYSLERSLLGLGLNLKHFHHPKGFLQSHVQFIRSFHVGLDDQTVDYPPGFEVSQGYFVIPNSPPSFPQGLKGSIMA